MQNSPDQRLNQPLQWKYRILTSGPLGRSKDFIKGTAEGPSPLQVQSGNESVHHAGDGFILMLEDPVMPLIATEACASEPGATTTGAHVGREPLLPTKKPSKQRKPPAQLEKAHSINEGSAMPKYK